MKAKAVLALELLYQGQTKRFESSESTFTIGRTKACALSLPKCDVISREHLKVEIDGDEIWITDLGSSNGTFYRKAKLMPNMACLYTGETFYLGAEGQGVKVSMVLTPAEKEEPLHNEFTDANRTEAIVTPPEMFLAPESIVTPDKEDEHLLKMQMIEAEIDELTHKKHVLKEEIAELTLNETKHRLLENEFKTNLNALARVQVELEEKRAGVFGAQNELAQVQVNTKEARIKETEAEEAKAKAIAGMEEKQSQLKTLIERIEARETELNDRSKLLDACEAQVAIATEKFEDLTDETKKKRQEFYDLEAKIKELHVDQENLEKNKKSSEQQITVLIEKIQDLEVQKIKSEKAYLSQCEQEDEHLEKLKTSREESEALYAKAQTEYERIKQKTKFELESLDAESKLKKTVLEREVEEILTRKTVVMREVDDTRHLLTDSQAKLAGLLHSVQTEQTRFTALRSDVQKIEADKLQIEEKIKALTHKQDHLDEEVKAIEKQAFERAHQIKAEAEALAHAQIQALEAKRASAEKEMADERLTFNREIEDKRKQHLVEDQAFKLDLEEKRQRIVVEHETAKRNLEEQKLEALQAFQGSLQEFEESKQRALKEHEEKIKALRLVTDGFEKEQAIEKEAFAEEMEILRKQAMIEHEALVVSLREKTNHIEKEQAEHRQAFVLEMEELKKQAMLTHQASMQALKEKTARIEKEQYDQKMAFAHEFEEVKKRAQQDHESTLAGLKENETELRAKYAEELRIWSADEEARVKKVAAKNVEIFAHHVAMRSLSEYQSAGSVSVASLIATLEKKIVEGVSGQVHGEGIYNPDFKEGVRKFWVQAVAGIAAVIVLGIGFRYGPQIIGSKLETMKVANQQEDARFMEEVKAQRERMLALHLEAKDVFQEHYVDNILYNPGYLAMKLNPDVQKQWTVELSKFFFNELLFDDRKVVEFIPIETALMTNLNETYKILNSQNFDANLVKMKQLEEQKSEEIWLLVGGRDNWLKIRRKEADFYAAHGLSASKNARTPASP